MVDSGFFCQKQPLYRGAERNISSPVSRLMQGSGVKRSRAGAREGLRVEQLEEFAAACAHINFQPPLSAKQAAFLQSLQAERLY